MVIKKKRPCMEETSNKAKGDAFEEFAKRSLEAYLDQTLEHPEPIDGHKFDLATPDKSIIVECKCLEWTVSGNVPNGKINNLNEAVSWLTKVASATQKILCLKRSVHPLKKESLAEYFVRTSKFLPDSKIIVIEIDDEGITRKLTH